MKRPMRYEIAIAAFLCGFIFSGCKEEKGDPKAEAPAPVKVEHEQDANSVRVDHPEQFPLTAAVERASMSQLVVTGVVSPDISRTVPVISLAVGRVVEIRARLGDSVKKGQVLLRVQSADMSGAFSDYRKAVVDEQLSRTQVERAKLLYDKDARRVTGVVYTDMKTGEEYEQPAGLVVLSSYVFGNVQQMLLAGIGEPYDPTTGKGVVGKNYCYQFEAGGEAFFEGREFNPFMGAPGMGTVIDDFNGENFDHAGLGFFGGGYINCGNGGAPPIGGRILPKGEPRWGVGWKQAEAKWYRANTRFNTQGSVYAHRDNFMDLDPTYKDALGRPMIRLTYNATENDHKMSRYLVEKMEGVIKAMNPTHYEVHNRPKNFTIVPYQSTHNTGGTIMGADPKSSVVNRYLQAWGAHNLFIQGASVFPQQHGYNPTGTLGALAYWSAKAITEKYLKSPGPLVNA